MSKSEDVKTLFRRFGGQASTYREIGANQQAEAAAAKWPILGQIQEQIRPAPPSAALASLTPGRRMPQQTAELARPPGRAVQPPPAAVAQPLGRAPLAHASAPAPGGETELQAMFQRIAHQRPAVQPGRSANPVKKLVKW